MQLERASRTQYATESYFLQRTVLHVSVLNFFSRLSGSSVLFRRYMVSMVFLQSCFEEQCNLVRWNSQVESMHFVAKLGGKG